MTVAHLPQLAITITVVVSGVLFLAAAAVAEVRKGRKK